MFVGINYTFDDNSGMKNEFTKYLRDSCMQHIFFVSELEFSELEI